LPSALTVPREYVNVLPVNQTHVLAGHPSLQLSSEVKSWLGTCPDVERVNQWLTTNIWLRSPSKCAECGEKMPTSELRYDQYGAFSDPSNLICHDCFLYFCEPTIANPDGIEKSIWPPYLVPGSIDTSLYDSEFKIVDAHDVVVGSVTNYNPQFHTGHVTLDAFDGCDESGSLDPNYRVVDTDGQVIGPLPKNAKNSIKTDLDDIPMVYHVTLDDLLAGEGANKQT
jgi:hypothetical protein